MYKRRDWLHLHGADGGQSSGSDSSDDSEAASQGMARLACCGTLVADLSCAAPVRAPGQEDALYVHRRCGR